MTRYVDLMAGDPAPDFIQASAANPRYVFGSAAGRYLVLCFYGAATLPSARRALDAAHARPDLFDDRFASFFGVSVDPTDQAQARVADRYPGFRHFWDFDRSISRLYGAASLDQSDAAYRPVWVIVGPSMRVTAVIPFAADGSDIAATLAHLDAAPPPERAAGFDVQAPILILPQVLEPEICERLIALYEAQGGRESGFMREIDGKTRLIADPSHKRRRDADIDDPALIQLLQERVKRRIIPEIKKVHQFEVTRMERYIVSCYSEDDGGHFRAHRDNTTKGTAHRRFAVSINLTSDFDGGEVCFPEYGPRSFKAPTGGAVVFSCSLLHAVSTVTRGRRFAFLPFLYDDAAAAIRERNNAFLSEEVGAYRREPADATP